MGEYTKHGYFYLPDLGASGPDEKEKFDNALKYTDATIQNIKDAIESGIVNNADKVDGYDAGHSSGQIPISDGTLNTNLNADKVDGYDAGHSSGQIPISDGALNTNLNADKLDDYHASTIPAPNTIPVADGNGYLNSWVAQGSGSGLDADKLDGYHAGHSSGQIPISDGTLNTSLNADKLDGYDAIDFVVHVPTIADLVNLSGNIPKYVYVTGYHAPGDGAFGSHIFEWDPTSTEPHNGGTIIELGAPFPTDWNDQTQLDAWFNYDGGTTGRYKLRYNGSVNVKWFGAKGDGIINDTKAIQSVIDLKVSEVYIPEGQYTVDSLSVDIAYTKIVGAGPKSVLDFSESSETNCIILYGSVYPPYYQNGNGLYHLYIKGSGETGNQTGILIDTDTQGGASSHININYCTIDGFKYGIRYLNHAYFIRHISTDIKNCDTCLYNDGTGTDKGENIIFIGCAFYNSNKIFDWTDTTGDVYFSQCSFDYSKYIFYKIDTAKVYVNNCHIEYTHDVQDSFCYLTGNRGYLSISDSHITHPNSNIDARIGLVDGGYLSISKTHLHNLGGSFSQPYLIEVINGGKVDVFRNEFYQLDNISKGLSNINLFNNSCAYIIDDTAEITKTRTGTNIILTNGTNYDELSVYKEYGGGSAAKFCIYFKLCGATRYKIVITSLSDTTLTGTSYWSIGKAREISFNDLGLPRASGVYYQGSVAKPLDNLATNDIIIDEYMTKEDSTYAEYGLITVNLDSVVGPGTLDMKIVVYGI